MERQASQQSEMQRLKEEKSCVKIQSLIRGKLARNRFNILLTEKRIFSALFNLLSELNLSQLRSGSSKKSSSILGTKSNSKDDKEKDSASLLKFDSLLIENLSRFLPKNFVHTEFTSNETKPNKSFSRLTSNNRSNIDDKIVSAIATSRENSLTKLENTPMLPQDRKSVKSVENEEKESRIGQKQIYSSGTVNRNILNQNRGLLSTIMKSDKSHVVFEDDLHLNDLDINSPDMSKCYIC